MSFGDPNNPYSQQPPQGHLGYPQQAPQGVPPQYGYPQQAPQDAPPQYGYPQQPYGAYPPPGMPGAGLPPLAHWGQRVGGYLLDVLIIAGPMYALGFIDLAGSDDLATAEPGIFFAIGVVYALAMAVYQLYLEGKTGQTTGKKVLGISLHREADGRPLGFGMPSSVSSRISWTASPATSAGCGRCGTRRTRPSPTRCARPSSSR